MDLCLFITWVLQLTNSGEEWIQSDTDSDDLSLSKQSNFESESENVAHLLYK